MVIASLRGILFDTNTPYFPLHIPSKIAKAIHCLNCHKTTNFSAATLYGVSCVYIHNWFFYHHIFIDIFLCLHVCLCVCVCGGGGGGVCLFVLLSPIYQSEYVCNQILRMYVLYYSPSSDMTLIGCKPTRVQIMTVKQKGETPVPDTIMNTFSAHLGNLSQNSHFVISWCDLLLVDFNPSPSGLLYRHWKSRVWVNYSHLLTSNWLCNHSNIEIACA